MLEVWKGMEVQLTIDQRIDKIVLSLTNMADRFILSSRKGRISSQIQTALKILHFFLKLKRQSFVMRGFKTTDRGMARNPILMHSTR
jgi:hypothetical protein